MTVRPKVLGPRVMLKALEAAEATAGGLILPDEVRERESRGMVVCVGDPYHGDSEPPVSVGEVVVYAAHGTNPHSHPTKVVIDNDETGKAEEFVVVHYGDLLVVLEDVSSR